MSGVKAEEIIRVLKDKFKDAIIETRVQAENRVYVKVAREHLVEVAKFARDVLKFDMPITSGGVDYPKRNAIEVFWGLHSTELNKVLILKVDVDRSEPKTPSLVSIWPGLDKFERETWEMLGVNFIGHPDLRPLLLPEDWHEGYPLRKDFSIEKYVSKWGDEGG